MSLTGSHDQLCLRPLSGTLDFKWPDTASYVDVVFVQDFSGSFDGTIADVGKAVNNIISGLDMGTDADGISPKDRAMFTTFQGSQGMAYINSSGAVLYEDSNYSYKIDNLPYENSPLITRKDAATSSVTKYFNDVYTEGGTPTIDGMRKAQDTYQRATNTNNIYNNKSYVLPNGAKRQRETIYVLVTDGAANTATWTNIPDSTKKLFNLYDAPNSQFEPGNINSAVWNTARETDGYSIEVSSRDNALARRGSIYSGYTYYHGGGYYQYGGYTYYNKGQIYYPGSNDKAYLWSDERQSPDGDIVVGDRVGRTEDYKVMLDGMKIISDELKSTGGLDRSNATMVTAFWENLNPTSGLISNYYGYSSGWYNMRPKIMNTMTSMATKPEYFATSSNITDFANKLIQTFKNANNNNIESVKFNFNRALIPGADYKLIKIGDNPDTTGIVETEYEIKPGINTKIEGSDLTIDMTNLLPGNYRIEYTATEGEFMPNAYNPLSSIDFTFNSTTSSLNTSGLETEANPKKDCDIDIKKYVASTEEDYNNGTTYKELDKRRQSFYFDTVYTFTAKVQEVNNTMVLKDNIDSRLDILDVSLVETPNNTLVAEMKGGDSGDIASTPAISVDKTTNTVQYSLPQNPKIIDGRTYPFGGYEGKEYVFKVKAQIKSTVTDAQIEEMIKTPDSIDGKSIGIPNTSQIETDGNIKYSNKARVVPPELKIPTIQKFIAKIPTDNSTPDWKGGLEILNDSSEKYRHKIELTMPTDTTGYESLVVKDPLDSYLNYDANSVKAYYIKKDGSRVDIPAENLTKNTDASNVVSYTIKETSTTPNLFEDMAEGKVSFEFDVQIKPGSNLITKYSNDRHRYEIDNTSSFSINGRDFIPSNKVTAVIPTPEIKLTKFGKLRDQDGNRLTLANVIFELKDTTGAEPDRKLNTEVDGTMKISELTPGKNYTLTELSTPEGYVVDKTPWNIIVNNDNSVSITGGPTDPLLENKIDNAKKTISVNNNGPVSPIPEKMLLGEFDSNKDYKKPTMNSPYILKKNGENVTYQIRVPIKSVEGYTSIKIEDKFDKYLSVDMKTAKAYILPDPGSTSQVEVDGTFIVAEGNLFTWEKTGGFKDLENKTLVIEVEAKMLNTVDRIFADTSTSYYPQGKIPNKAKLTLNEEPSKETNETVIQLTKAEVSLTKLIKGTGAADSTATPLTSDLSASFTLYKLRDPSQAEPSPIPDETKDKSLHTYTITGDQTLKIPLLDTGTYYFIETSTPRGYTPIKGPIPNALIKVPDNQGGVVDVGQALKPINEKTTTPTITKKARIKAESGQAVNAYSKNDLPISIGQTWQYAIDTPMPAPLDSSKTYTITDNIPKAFDITGVRVQVGDGSTFTDSPELDKLLKQNIDYANPNDLKLIIEGSNISSLGIEGKVIRIEVDAKVKHGVNLLESGYLKNGVVPNTAHLEFGDVKLQSTVNVKPQILRNFVFTKTLGKVKEPGATFKLYKRGSDGSMSVEPAKDPFTGQAYSSTSNDLGEVTFNNVVAGDYIMVESPLIGTFPIYENIWVTVSDTDIPSTDPDAIVFRTLSGAIIEENQVVNNEPATISGVKTWDDEDNRYNNRPDYIAINLYRYSVDEGGPDSKKLIDTKRVSKPWTYEFKDTIVDGKMTNKYPKYDNNGDEYTYVVEEEPVPAYSRVTEGVTGYDLKNKIDQVSLNMIKKDTNGTPLSGRKFVITNANGNTREHTTDTNGILSIPDLTKGQKYVLKELFTPDDKYLELNSTFSIEIDLQGNINIAGLKRVPVSVDLDNNPSTKDYAFEVINHEKVTPVKKVGPANGTLPDSENYKLNNLKDKVTYSITQEKINLQGITDIVVKDTVDPSMAIVNGSGKVVAIDNTGAEEDVTSIFSKDISDVGKTITFTTGSNYQDFTKLNGKKLRFTFNAYVAMDTDKLIELHPDLIIPNTGTITFNNDSKTTTKTNNVNIVTKLVNLEFMKKVQGLNGSGNIITERLPEGTSASFDLYNMETDKRYERPYSTDIGGKVSLPNFDVGKFMLRETKAPEGYNKVEDIYFNVVYNSEKDKLEVQMLDGKDGKVTKTIESNPDTGLITLDDVVDPMPDLPTINKMVRPDGKELVAEDPTTPTPENKSYDMPYWNSKFDYIIDIKIPDDTSKLTKLELYDLIPDGLIMYDITKVKRKIGTGEGSNFTTGEEPTGLNFTYNSGINKDGIYDLSLDTSDKYTINQLAGKTIRVTIPVMIDQSLKYITELLVENGKLVNTASLKVNDKYKLESVATATPPKQYGAEFIKMSPDEHKLREATFKLEQHTNADGVPDGPPIPDGYRTDYISRDNGTFIMDKSLLGGKYFLTEHFLPTSWIDGNGVTHWATFTADSYGYTIEFLTEQKKDAQGKPMTDPQGKPIMIDVVKLYERTVVEGPDGSKKYGEEKLIGTYDGTVENPVKLLNLQTLIVPVVKRWDDNSNINQTRPKKINFLLQRSIINGEKDDIDPTTGQLSPKPGDAPDTLDVAFNDFAKNHDVYNKTVDVSSGNLQEIIFNSDTYLTFGSTNNFNILRTSADGKTYSYFVQEIGTNGYKASYSVEPLANNNPKSIDESVTSVINVTNTLKTTDLKINKVDNSESEQPVGGATFNLSYESNGSTVVKTLQTETNGQLDLSPAIYPNKVYKLKEIEAPTGYLKNPTEYTIVTDTNNIPTVYSKYVGPGDAGNVVAPEFKSTVDTAVDPNVTKYTLKVVDNKTTTPIPEKKVNGQTSYTLESLSKDFEYSVEIPVTSIEGYKSFVIEDTVNDLLDIVSGTAKITADGNDISTKGTIDIANKTIKFTMTDNFADIQNKKVKLTFRAKVADGVTLDQLKQYVSQPENNAGIANTAKLTVNDKSANSNEVYVVPDNPGAPPEVTKTVNGVRDLDLKTNDQVFNYRVEAKVPTNVLGYGNLSLTDTLSKVLEVSGGIKLSVVDTNGVITPLTESKDYILTNTANYDPKATSDGIITAKFVDEYDYTKLAGKTIVMEFSSRMKSGLTQEQLTTYETGALFFKKIEIPNTANILLNNQPGTESKATVTPPIDPQIEKGALDESGNLQAESIKLQKEQLERATDAAALKPITFEIDAYVPVNTSGYNKFVISDQLKEILKYKSATVSVEGIGDTSDIAIAESNGFVTATITGQTNISKYAGKKISFVINTEIDTTKNISEYVIEDKLNNTATIEVNDASKVMNDVNLIVPKGSLEITKTLDGASQWPQGQKAVFKLEKYIGGKLVTVNNNIEITSLNPVTINGLVLGNYKLTEVSAPAGYEVGSPRDILIDPNVTATQKISINDTKTPVQKKKVDKSFFEDYSKERTFTITTPVNSVDGINNLLIEDTLDDYFKLVDGSLKTEIVKAESTTTDPSITATNSGQKISLNINTPEELAKVKDSKIVITYKVSLKDASGGVFIYDNLPEEYKKTGIPNVSTVSVNNRPSLSTQPVKVSVPVGNVSLTKTADGEALPEGTSATFALYKKASVSTQSDKFLRTYSTSKENGIDKIYVNNLGPGQYYFKETSAPAGYVLNDTNKNFEILVNEAGATSTVADEGFAGFTINNTKSHIPAPIKTVNDKQHLDLNSVQDTFHYKVEVPVTKVDGWTEFTLTDPIDSQLTIDINTVKVNIQSPDGTTTEISPDSIGADGQFTTENNLITFKYTNLDKIKALVGKTVILTFDAKITNITEFIEAHPDSIVGNTANLNVGNGGTSSNRVTVTPPGETPTPIKTVNGKNSLTLGKKDQLFFYDIRAHIPTNVTGYQSLTLSDTLKSVLETAPEKVTVYVNDVVNEDLKDKFLSVNGNDIVFKIDNATQDPDFDFKTLAGKTLRIGIESNIKSSATEEDLAKFKTIQGDVEITNESKLTINNDSKTSNTVRVTPPGNEPTVEKTVETGPTDTTKENLLINSKNTPFTYKVNVELPSNVEGYKSIRLEDTLQDVLEASSTQVLVDNAIDKTLTGLVKKDIANPNMISLDVPMDSNSTFKSYAGKTITLVINAKIKDTVNINQIAYKYASSAIPNNATLIFNGNPKVSNEVKVTPPSDTPTPIKDVNGQQAIALSNRDEEFVYNIRYTVPTNVTGFNNLTMTDELQKVLEIAKNSDSSNKIQVYVDEELDTDLTNKVDVSRDSVTQAQKVTLAIENGIMTSPFENLAGKTIRVEMKANIKKDADLSTYVNNSIPNQATLSLNGNPKTTSEVKVTPPLGDIPTLDKTVNDANEYKLTTLNQEHTYKIKSKIPTHVTGYQKIVINDSLEDVLEATGVNITAGGTDITGTIGEYGSLDKTKGVKLTLDKNFTALAGKELVVTINARVKDGLKSEQINPYLNAGSIPNKATLTFNDNRTIEDTVKVIPPSEKTSLDKKVNNQDAISISDMNDPLNYTMDIKVPQNTNDITKISLSDTFINIFKLGTASVQVTKDGVLDQKLTDEAKAGLSTNGQTVALNIVGATQANKYAGRVIKVTVPATIDSTKTLANYLESGVLPNTAKLSYTNDPTKDIEDTAKVTPPPGDKPSIEKKVEGQDEYVLTNLNDVHTYTVTSKVPANVVGYKKLTLSDNLVSILETAEKPTLSVGGQVVDEADYGTLTNESGKVELIITKNFDKLAGKDLVLTIKARVKADTDKAKLDSYRKNGGIPNVASLVFNDKAAGEDDVKVILPGEVPPPPTPEDPTPVKDVNGKTSIPLYSLDQEFTYNINTIVPIDISEVDKTTSSDTNTSTGEIKTEGTNPADSLKRNLISGGETPKGAESGKVISGGETPKEAESGKVISGEETPKETATKEVTSEGEASKEITTGEAPTEERVPAETATGEVLSKGATITGTSTEEVQPKVIRQVERPIGESMAKSIASEDAAQEETSKKVNFTQKYTKYVLTDDLEDILTTSKDMISVKVNNRVDDSLKENITVEAGNIVKLDIPVEKIDSYKGKNITLVINAKVKDGATEEELAPYMKLGSIPNTASLALTDKSSEDKMSNTVTVNPNIPSTPEKPKEETPKTPGVGTAIENHRNVTNTTNTSTSNTSNNSSSPNKRLVSTGDGRSPYFYGGIAALIGLALIAYGIKTRKEEKEIKK